MPFSASTLMYRLWAEGVIIHSGRAKENRRIQ
jgi:hypothetical protein